MSQQVVFSTGDFKKTRRLLKTYMNRKTKQKILRIRKMKRFRQIAKDREERNRESNLKKKLSSVKLLQYFVENSNSFKLKRLDYCQMHY